MGGYPIDAGSGPRLEFVTAQLVREKYRDMGDRQRESCQHYEETGVVVKDNEFAAINQAAVRCLIATKDYWISFP